MMSFSFHAFLGMQFDFHIYNHSGFLSCLLSFDRFIDKYSGFFVVIFYLSLVCFCYVFYIICEYLSNEIIDLFK